MLRRVAEEPLPHPSDPAAPPTRPRVYHARRPRIPPPHPAHACGSASHPLVPSARRRCSSSSGESPRGEDRVDARRRSRCCGAAPRRRLISVATWERRGGVAGREGHSDAAAAAGGFETLRGCLSSAPEWNPLTPFPAAGMAARPAAGGRAGACRRTGTLPFVVNLCTDGAAGGEGRGLWPRGLYYRAVRPRRYPPCV